MELEKIARNHAGDDQINWVTAIFMGLFHVGAIAALFFFTWKALVVACFLWWVSGSLGIGMSYHRLLTHRGYKTPKWVEYFLTVCATLALEGGPIFWVATHRIHHKYSDTERDVHSPKQGFWFCWFGSVADEGYSEEDILKHAADFTCYPELMWMHRHYWVTPVVVGIITFLVGGFSMLAIGYGGSIIFALHMASGINYFCHKGNNRRYETNDGSTNSLVMALLTFGEGWHNNHHHYPNTARAGFFWWEWDPVYYTLRVLAWTGLVWDVRGVPDRVKYDLIEE